MDRREIEKRLKQLEKENKELKKIVREESGTDSFSGSKNNVSRREFLKKVGAGTLGLGALSLAPAASQLKLTKNGIQNADSVDAGAINTQNQSTVRAYVGSDQSVSSNTSVTIKFDSTDIDRRGEWDSTNNKFVADSSGIYLVSYTTNHDTTASAGDRINSSVMKNGTSVAYDSKIRRSGSEFESFNFSSTLVKLSVGDEITFDLKNKNSSDTIVSGKNQSWAIIRKLG